MAFERYPAQGVVRFVYAMWSRDRSPLISTSPEPTKVPSETEEANGGDENGCDNRETERGKQSTGKQSVRTLMRDERCARRLASFSARFCLELLPPSSNSSMAVGIILGGRYTPPSAPSSASSSTLLTRASGLGLNCSGSSPAPLAVGSYSSPSTPSLAILRSLSIWYLSFLSMGLSFSR